MDGDTSIGGAAQGFPVTGATILAAASDPDPLARSRALDRLVSVYWKPVYKYLRIRWRASNEDAKDWTQGFFAVALEKDYLRRYQPERSKFRTYLRTCLDGYVANQLKAASRIKRGGQAPFFSLDFDLADTELTGIAGQASEDPERLFHREWARSIFQGAIERVRQDCAGRGRPLVFEVFSRYDLDPSPGESPTYSDIARQLELTPQQVTNFLTEARRKFRAAALGILREVCSNENEYRLEARQLFGVETE